jgi:hypothetical protein
MRDVDVTKAVSNIHAKRIYDDLGAFPGILAAAIAPN